MQYIYSFGVFLYVLSIRIASYFNPKAKKWIVGRRKWKQKLPQTNKKVIWFHCASLGEFDQGLPLMDLIKKEHPDIFILVTFFSPSGMEHYHKRKAQIDHVMYLPADLPGNVAHFINHWKPSALFLIKYEFWCNYILKATEKKIPVFSVSTLLREDHRYFKWYGEFFKETLKKICHFYVQNENTAKLLEKLNINKFTISGDTRFDRVIDNKEHVKPNECLEIFLKGQKAIIIGSSWPKDEEILLPFLLNHPEEKIIIAPHDITEKHIKSLEVKLESRSVRYTSFDASFSGNIVILNTIGHLASAYKYGKIAYVGGGFSGRLHNILEPAVFGLPVIFGPNYSRFPEADLFVNEGVGFSVANSKEFENKLHSIDHSLVEISARTAKVVADNKGAAHRIYSSLKDKFPYIF